MAITVAIIMLVFVLAIAYQLCEGQSKKRKYVTWGITIMLAIAPLLSWLLSIAYAAMEGSGWAAVALMSLLFPSLVLIGLVVLFIGIFRKKEIKTSDG